MATESEFSVHEEPRSRHVSTLRNSELTTLVAGGIINPYGPTLMALVVDGPMNDGDELPILAISLNPFNQSVVEVGKANLGEVWHPMRDLGPFFNIPFGGCPTLLLPSVLFDRQQQIELYSMFLIFTDNGPRVYEYLMEFPGDPWSRVQAEVDRTLGSSHRAQESEDKPKRLPPRHAKEIAEMQLDPDNINKELQAFMFAWNGAIEFQGDSPISENAMSLDEFAHYFALMAISCNLPSIK